MNYSLIKALDPNFKYDDYMLSQAVERIRSCGIRLERTPRDELERRGFRVEFASLSVAGQVIWGRVDLIAKIVYVDLEAVNVLIERSNEQGGESLDLTVAVNLVLAHELYHVIDRCTHYDSVTELAAIVFALQYSKGCPELA
ncbi:MAG: hypothetical protein K6A35_01155 [bacterium]|nr:hypothetical protein [bacterium]